MKDTPKDCSASDRFGLVRFVDAQFPLWDRVLRELKNGRKVSCWMWFVFPQLRGLGRSATADRYGLSGLEEAAAYLQHPVLGPRLIECTRLTLTHPEKSALQIFGMCDDIKFHSCLTLFCRVPAADPVFQAALDQVFSGQPDENSIQLLNR